jgi:hypothetical protein
MPTAPDQMVTMHIPFRFLRRGGRKEMQVPQGKRPPRGADGALVKGLARAFRWQRMLESGEFATIGDLAAREGIAPSYVTRVLRLTLLAPDLVEAILDGTRGPEVTLARVLEPFPSSWTEQMHELASTRLPARAFGTSPTPTTSEAMSEMTDQPLVALRQDWLDSRIPEACAAAPAGARE